MRLPGNGRGRLGGPNGSFALPSDDIAHDPNSRGQGHCRQPELYSRPCIYLNINFKPQLLD